MSFDLEKLSQSITDTVNKVVTGVKGAMDNQVRDLPVEQKAIIDLVDMIIMHNEASIKELKVLRSAITAKLKDQVPAEPKAKDEEESKEEVKPEDKV